MFGITRQPAKYVCQWCGKGTNRVFEFHSSAVTACGERHCVKVIQRDVDSRIIGLWPPTSADGIWATVRTMTDEEVAEHKAAQRARIQKKIINYDSLHRPAAEAERL